MSENDLHKPGPPQLDYFYLLPHTKTDLRGLQLPLPGTCNPGFNVLWPVM